MDPKGIALMGEAAESFVKLQWIEYFTELSLIVIMFGFIGYVVYKLLKSEGII